MSMKYLGGDCSQSINMQSGFACEDQSGGPGTSSPVYIEATDARGTNLFQGNVEIGGVFEMTNNGDRLNAVAIINIYDNETSRMLLQTVNFDTSGSTFLSLNEIFGSNHVVGWFNDQGVVDLLHLEFSILTTQSAMKDRWMRLCRVLFQTLPKETSSFRKRYPSLAPSPSGESLPPITINLSDVRLDMGRAVLLD